MQVKFADKMKLAKSKSTPASTSQDTRSPTKPKLKPMLSVEHQGRITVFQGIKLENDPLERKSTCASRFLPPRSSTRASKISSRIHQKSYYSYYSCERCHLIFVSGKHYTGD